MTDVITTSTTISSIKVADEDVWPGLSTLQQNEAMELPVNILQAQAKRLAPHTEYLLKGFVRSSNFQDGVMYHSFYVYAPYVQDAPFKLFYLKHGVAPTEKIVLVWGDIEPLRDEEIGTATSLDDLRLKIKEVLNDERILQFLRNLLTLSKSAKAAGDANTDAEEDTDSIAV